MNAAKRIEMIAAVAGWLAAGIAGATPVTLNPSFEVTPYPTSGTSWDEGWGSPVNWTYNGAGHGGGVYGGTSAPQLTAAVKVFPIPDLTHAAYLWTAWGADAKMSQAVSGFEVGKKYVVTYLENSQNGIIAGDLISVTFDSTTVVPGHVIANNPAAWYTVTSDPFTATSTSHTLAFHMYTPASGDRSSFVFDQVAINEFVVPEPAGLALLSLGALGLTLRRRRQ